MKKINPDQQAALEALGHRVADRLEQPAAIEGAVLYANLDDMPPLVALKDAAVQRAALARQTSKLVARARAENESWHRIGASLGMTAEGARRKYATA